MLYFIRGYEEDNTPVVKTFTQDEVNRINKSANDAAAAAKAQLKEMEETVNQLRNQESLTKEEKATLEGKMKEMEERGLTEMQKLQKEFEKKEKTFTQTIDELSKSKTELLSNLHGIKIDQEITSAATSGEYAAVNPSQILRMLKGQAQVDEEGKVVLKGFEFKENDAVVVADLSPQEAIDKMRAMPQEWGNLFKNPKVNGSTMHNRTHGFEKPVKDQSMDEFMANRNKENK